MADTAAHAADHLELLARELVSYDLLDSRIVLRGDGPAYLWVVSKQAAGMKETITCQAGRTGGTVAYLWSWGQEIIGSTLTDKARSIAYVLHADPTRM
ncbi:MAG TPA: hypothetical protein VFU43_06715 [Streptosporangiaceae bacterium]|nr:hypothetical protein [Streptosporangiaceae bacterium]